MKTPPAPLGLRIRTFLAHRAIDREIVAGSRSEARPERELRERQLTDLRLRRGLASSIRGAVRFAEGDGAPSPMSAVMLQRPAVRHGRAALLDLADQLEMAARVNPRGVVLARELVRDGFSPLFDPCADRAVTEVARDIQDALAVWPVIEALAA